MPGKYDDGILQAHDVELAEGICVHSTAAHQQQGSAGAFSRTSGGTGVSQPAAGIRTAVSGQGSALLHAQAAACSGLQHRQHPPPDLPPDLPEVVRNTGHHLLQLRGWDREQWPKDEEGELLEPVKDGTMVDIKGDLLILAVGNGQQAGGGVPLCPDAGLVSSLCGGGGVWCVVGIASSL